MALIDNYGRRINYLRLSVTDRCNLRCSYCMPADGVRKLEHDELLTYEELYRVAEACVEQGIEKIRVTGGEPLVRRGLVPFLARLSSIPGLKELVLTTNGMLLEQMAVPLREAGVARVNVSLDSMRQEVFAGITRHGDVSRVMKGIEAAERAGFGPIKINMVVMRGVNDGEILDFAALTMDRPYTVRFIEYMPTLKDPKWEAQTMPGREILSRISSRYRLLPLVGTEMAGPSRNYKIEGALGGIGIITPVSGHFCDSCNRIRITATGRMRTCLFSEAGIDLKPLLNHPDPGRLRETLLGTVTEKPGRHHIAEEGVDTPKFNMSRIGG